MRQKIQILSSKAESIKIDFENAKKIENWKNFNYIYNHEMVEILTHKNACNEK